MKHIIFLLFLTASQASYSNDFRLSFGIGRSDIDLPLIEEDPNNDAGEDSFSRSIHIGYILPKNIIIDLGINSINDVSFFGAFDEIEYDAKEVLIGYLFRKESFYFEPKIGYANWETTINEGAFLNPGPEYSEREKGNDAFFIVTGGYRFTDTFGISISYKHLDFDYIEAKSYIFGFDLAF